jgi:hypothetical protein
MPEPTPPATLASALTLDGTSPAAYAKAARALAAADRSALRPLSIALLASYTIEIIRPYLVVEAARRGFDATVTAMPFGQLEQVALDQAGPLYAARPDVVVIATRLEELDADLVERHVALTPADAAARGAAVVERLVALAAAVRAPQRGSRAGRHLRRAGAAGRWPGRRHARAAAARPGGRPESPARRAPAERARRLPARRGTPGHRGRPAAVARRAAVAARPHPARRGRAARAR